MKQQVIFVRTIHKKEVEKAVRKLNKGKTKSEKMSMNEFVNIAITEKLYTGVS